MVATYSLEAIKQLVQHGAYHITSRAERDAFKIFGYDETDIIRDVLSLTKANFMKTMPASEKPGLFQDVYRKQISGQDAYIKIQVSRSGDAIIISFHEYT